MEQEGIPKHLEIGDMLYERHIPLAVRLDEIRKIEDSAERVERFWAYLKANPSATPQELEEEMDRLERTIPLTPEEAQIIREMEEENMQ